MTPRRTAIAHEERATAARHEMAGKTIHAATVAYLRQPSETGDPEVIGRRRDRFFFCVPPERALEIAADPSRFPEFNPLVRVPETSGRVEQLGNVYHQIFTLGPIHVSTRWETVRVDPPTLAERPLPPPPWTTVEVGQLPVFGTWTSTGRYEAVKAGTLITHDLEYALPDGVAGRFLDLVLMRPLLAVALGLAGRRVRNWIEAAED